MNHIFLEYQRYKGYIPSRTHGVLIAFEDGNSSTYGLYNAQGRGILYSRKQSLKSKTQDQEKHDIDHVSIK